MEIPNDIFRALSQEVSLAGARCVCGHCACDDCREGKSVVADHRKAFKDRPDSEKPLGACPSCWTTHPRMWESWRWWQSFLDNRLAERIAAKAK